ncbi:MAG TPA: toll/interleukin-1 receptor domain-containing protein, partial [Acidimicrobiales bacterium]
MGSIFISYRRTGSAGYGGRLDYDLRRHFGSTAVFRDIDGILPGRPFAEIIEQAVAESSVVLVLITGEWLDVTDAEGRRRLDQPDDFVRREIESALNSGVPLIPVLVDGAKVPSAQDLPPSIRRLGELQGIELTDGRWEFDLGRLIRALEVHVGPVEQATAPTI